MATIELNSNKINQMPDLINDVKNAVVDFKTELSNFKTKCLSINKSVCNLDDIISSIQASTQTQEEKIASLDTLNQNIEQYVSDAVRIDGDVADIINQRKDEFYSEYSSLKPDIEKSGWEKIKDGCKNVADWCSENWESICNLVMVVLIVVAIVAISVLTFGATAVLIAATVGAAVGFIGQLASDLISFAITGDWDGNWQSYFGAILGGAVGGILVLTGNVTAALTVDAAISTFFSQNLENLTGGEKRSNAEIWINTVISAGSSAIFSKIFGKITDKISKTLAKNFEIFSRLAGSGSYAASFKMVLTKLSRNQIKNFSIKTIRNGVVSGLIGDVFKNITGGIFDGFKELYEER